MNEDIKQFSNLIVQFLSSTNQHRLPLYSPNELKVYALFSSKDVRWNNETMNLALIPAYALEDAAAAVKNILARAGKNLNEWRIAEAAVYEYWKNLGPGQILPVPPAETKETRKEKSAKELSMYVRYVFANASEADKKTAERVLADFKNSTMKKPQSP
jgi:hypothetical protein